MSVAPRGISGPPGWRARGSSRGGDARRASGPARTVATGLAAAVALAALVLGPPVLLYRFTGSPLPHRVADWHQIVAVLSSRADGGLLLAVVRDGTWLAWLLFTACVLAEALAAARGRRAPWLRLGGIQGAAARLVALAAVAASTATASTLSASAATVTGQHASQPLAGPAQPGTRPFAAVPDGATVSGAPVVTVRSGDCLWSIAQRYLGAGDLYPEIASLNYGRPMGDGQVFTSASLILPGWQLLLPAGATADSAGQAAALPAVSEHPGHATADARYQRRHPAARVPATTAQPAASHDGNGSVGPGAGASDRADSAVSTTASRPGGRADQVPQAAMFVTGALAGAILTSLTRLRFRQRQERRRGRRIALPDSTAVLATEQRLRATTPARPLQRLGDALRILQAGVLASGAGLPDIVGVHVAPDVLEVLLAAPAAEAPPAPFEVSPGRRGMCWQLAPPALAALPAGSAACHVLPGLVTIGSTGDGYLLLDLESLQATGCDGPPALVDQVLTTIATELAAGQWSGWYYLFLVGCDELAPLGRAEHCATLDEALSVLSYRSARTAQRVAARAPADVRELRLAEPEDEDWGLTILVSRTEPSPDQLTRLLDLAVDSQTGVAVLFAGDPETPDGRMAPTALQLAPDPGVADGIVANVVPLQITVRPRTLSGAEYAAIGALFTAAADLGDAGQDEVPYTGYAAPPWIPQASAWRPDPDVADVPQPEARDYDEAHSRRPHDAEPISAEPDRFESADDEPAAHDVAVSVLGPLVIRGPAGPLQPKQAELVLALALTAPAGLSNSALCAMLGADPDHPKPTDAVRQIIARTRRRLGRASDGAEYIIHTGSGRYLLHPEASLDWSRFRELAASGRADDLRTALALVRGEPFSGGYFWWIDIPLIECVRAEVVDAAERLAEMELAAGSPRSAARAALSGLLAEASAEQLWRAVMRAEHAAGNLAGVTEAWRRCLDAIEDVAPGGEPHPDTAALYRRLTAAVPEPASSR
ncbi:MAG: BTAD domain-containing putative transcriptional regulator [Streptosporangiaceae bacterium]